jgi:hypothetical protein
MFGTSLAHDRMCGRLEKEETMTMTAKNSFLFPTKGKLILAGALFFLFGWIIYPVTIETLITDWYPIGFPMEIHAVGLCPPPGDCIDFSWTALIVDLATWYLVSAIVLRAFRKKIPKDQVSKE